MSQIVVQLNPDVPPTGSDLGIVNAARRSFGKRSETLTDADKNLLRFLARGLTQKDFNGLLDQVASCTAMAGEFDSLSLGTDLETLEGLLWTWRNTPTHDTPINHGFFSFEVKAPIFCRAQLVKNEYLIMSEFSRRYITDDVEFYEHTYREASKDKKQGSGGTHTNSDYWVYEAAEANRRQVYLYQAMLDAGIAPEQARGVLPQDLMTAWTWSGTFGAFVKMCQLRLSSDVQAETRYIAEEVYKHLKQQFPVAAPLFVFGKD